MGVYTSINDGTAYFQPTIYTGNGNNGKVITNYGNSNLQPDWLWGKCRNLTQNHNVFDTSRGLSSRLTADQTAAANSDSTTITAVSSDGFTLGSSNNLNNADDDFVVWQWKANGGTTSSNSSGSITSTVQANTTAGFSIVTYTGTGSNATIGHGLGATPDAVFIKRRDGGNDWILYHKGLTSATYYLSLNDDGAEASASNVFNSTAPTSSVLSVGSSSATNANGSTYVAYVFSSIQGYSKFGSYIGNGNTDGPFIYTGFKPAFVMVKRLNTTNHWHMLDDQRDPDNVTQKHILADLDNAEASNTWMDFVSNGFTLRTTLVGVNSDTEKYVYYAFASSPFVSSAGVPATAR